MKSSLNKTDRIAALRIVATYAVFGGLWIFLSDRMLEMLIHDPHKLTELSTAKGFLFLAVTGFVLYQLIARHIQKSNRAEEERDRVRTEHLEAEIKAAKALRESEERLKRSQEIAHLGSWELDVVNNALVWSDEVYRIFGLKPQQFGATYEAFLEAVHPDDRDAVNAAYAGSLREGKDTYEIEHRVVRRATGEVRFVHEKCEHVRDEANRIVRSVGMVHDITERKNHEQQLVAARNDAEAASRAKSQFLANMSHELRTPLNGVLGMLQLVIGGHAGPVDPEQKKLLENARISAKALLRIISDILDLSKIEAGKLVVKNSQFSLRECISDVISFFSVDAHTKGLALTSSISENVPEEVRGDCLRLRQVLVNLIANAIKFTEHGSVNIEVAASGNASGRKTEVTFTITDTGIGVAPDKRHLLFNSFSQVDDSDTRRYGGVGLGLAISKNIVEIMGGAISFESTEGSGSSFIFTVPFELAGEAAQTDATLEHPKPAVVSATEPRNEPLVLAAEDDDISGRLLRSQLASKGMKMDLARTGSEAVEMWEKGRYDLIIMDIQMPKMDGITATRVIREKEAMTGGHIPIVAMTAHAYNEDKERCLAAGMDAYLTKPVDFEKGMGVIMSLLQKELTDSARI